MNTFEKIIYFLSGTIETPKPLGFFHVFFIALVFIMAFLFCKYFLVSSEKIYKTILFWCWTLMFLFEVYKQIQQSFHYDGEKVTWKYNWSAFPFQFCSTPLYVTPLIIFLKDGKVRDALTAYSCSYVMVAGILVYLLPGTVFGSSIMMNIQTMVHHGMQIFVGIYIAAYNYKKLSFNYFLKGMLVFVIAVELACIFNFVGHIYIDGYFNMFYISPYFNAPVEIANWLNNNLPYPCYQILYTIGFSILALLSIYIHKKVFYSEKFLNFYEKQLEKQVL